MFPAPGVYEGETTPEEQITVVQLISPSKFATGACTFNAEQLTSTVELAVITICPPALNSIEQPFE
jgi:hypothetical protein